MIVLKFGGSSVSSPENLQVVAGIISGYCKSSKKPVVVCSALGGVTDQLLALSRLAAAGDLTYLDGFAHLVERHHSVAKALFSSAGGVPTALEQPEGQGYTSEVQEIKTGIVEVKAAFESVKMRFTGYGTSPTQSLGFDYNASGFAHELTLQNLTAEISSEFLRLENKLNGIYLLEELSERSTDAVAGTGEILASKILSAALTRLGVANAWIDARDLIISDDTHPTVRARLPESFALIQARYKEAETKAGNPLWVVPGFIASSSEGVMTTLGRGGSDYTASILGAALDATEIEIWTDVHGFLTADPRKVKKAFPITHLSYEEAMEMSHFGAKVLYPPTVMPAFQKQIPIRIRNTFDINFPGTLISASSSEKRYTVKGVTAIEEVSLLTLKGRGMASVTAIPIRLFGSLANNRIQVILIMQGSSEYSMTFAVYEKSSDKAVKIIHEEFNLEIESGLLDAMQHEQSCLVAVVGENMKHMPGIAGRFLTSLGRNGINVTAIAQGSSELTIAVAIGRENLSKALNAAHETFFLSDTRTLNLFVIGVGNIGGTLLNIMEEQKEFLNRRKSVELNLAGVANSKKMLFSRDGVPMGSGKKQLGEGQVKMVLDLFIQEMIDYNLPNSVFIDCTADTEIASRYAEILEESISIVTPNKVANSGSFEYYTRLGQIKKKRGVSYLYETNVGAGLPVIGTLNDLLASGDKVLKIEAVLSGSLSFIFNQLRPGKAFSAIVREAMDLGYTEPDPRTDLSGADFAKKLVILARESGIPMELREVKIDSILPAHYFEGGNAAEFMQKLPAEDSRFTGMIEKALASQRLIRLIGIIEHGKASISLVEADISNPFYNLSGSDNLIAFTTNRYRERPLVIKGPGAGAEVTAAGVFSEIITISNTVQAW